MSLNDINNAASALNSAASAYHSKVAQIDSRVAAKEAEVAQFLSGAREKLAAPKKILFDPAVVHTKTSLALETDPNKNWQTKWGDLPGLHSLYVYANSQIEHASLMLARSYWAAPGHYEEPKYVKDKSWTRSEFILAPYNASSEDINGYLDANPNVTPGSSGGWSAAAYACALPIINIGDRYPFQKLFVRFRNLAFTPAPEVPDGTPPQEISTFGGEGNFAIQELNVFKK